MGEPSKTSGENGEKITEELLKLIGWSNLLKGVSVQCSQLNAIPLVNLRRHR